MKDTANKLILGTLCKHLGNHRLNSELVSIANDITEVLDRSKQLASDGVLANVAGRSELLAFKDWFNDLPDESDDRLYITDETISRFKANCG